MIFMESMTYYRAQIKVFSSITKFHSANYILNYIFVLEHYKWKKYHEAKFI